MQPQMLRDEFIRNVVCMLLRATYFVQGENEIVSIQSLGMVSQRVKDACRRHANKASQTLVGRDLIGVRAPDVPLQNTVGTIHPQLMKSSLQAEPQKL
eukprot:2410774-Amphidinium_carterae.1